MSSARIIDGKGIAAVVRRRVAEGVQARIVAGSPAPVLATVLVGEDPASQVYVRNKHRACEEVGIESVHHELPTDTGEQRVLETVEALAADPSIDGILVQLPIPGDVDSSRVINAVPPEKDVDGLTPSNAGRLALGSPALVPCTPAGVMEILDHEQVELSGAEAVVVGRSDLVGRPVASLLLGRDATVTIAHSRTRDLGEVCRRADLLIAAVGVPGLITPEMVAVGAVVVDVGINRTEDGLVGDVDPAVGQVASAVTPVPGGVGPMTIAMLLQNTLDASELRR